MALTAQEQALLDSLTKKANETPAPSRFTSLESIVHELVRTASQFSAEPHVQQEMLDYLDSVINPTVAANETPTPVS